MQIQHQIRWLNLIVVGKIVSITHWEVHFMYSGDFSTGLRLKYLAEMFKYYFNPPYNEFCCWQPLILKQFWYIVFLNQLEESSNSSTNIFFLRKGTMRMYNISGVSPRLSRIISAPALTTRLCVVSLNNSGLEHFALVWTAYVKNCFFACVCWGDKLSQTRWHTQKYCNLQVVVLQLKLTSQLELLQPNFLELPLNIIE